MKEKIKSILDKYQTDASRLIDILHEVMDEYGFVSAETISQVSEGLRISEAQVNETISFYHFFSDKPRGKYNIFLNNSITSCMRGFKDIKEVFEKESGVEFGNVGSDGLIGLYITSCIGMNDQGPAAIINDRIFTKLTPYRAKSIIKGIKEGKTVEELVYEGNGDGNNAHPLMNTMIVNNIRMKSLLLNNDYKKYEIIKDYLTKNSPQEIIQIVEESNLRGRGGAGFPTGLKWKFGSKMPGEHRIIICNADEGEPGTFKDRVILTEYSDIVFEGMVIAAYATAADMGVLYLRYEYRYMLEFLNTQLAEMRNNSLLGDNIAGIKDFNFDIRIQLGAGAYVCGEESAMIESMEGKRGEPRDKPPFPVERGYLDYPTIVNNVETLASAVRIIKNGAEWYKSFGTNDSLGTKLLSVSGDCRFPGIYEVNWGVSIKEVLEMAGAENVQAVQVGGPSGTLVNVKDIDNLTKTELMKWYKPSGMMAAQKSFDRKLCYSDLPTGGSIIIFNKERDILGEVVMNFMDFFIEESCGSCSTCRNLPYIMKQKLIKIIDGHGVRDDIDDLLNWGKIIKVSRCGLGQTAANPVLSSILNFRHLYEEHVKAMTDYDNQFELAKSVSAANSFVGRKFIHHNS